MRRLIEGVLSTVEEAAIPRDPCWEAIIDFHSIPQILAE
jgi:hypothetical protein